MAKRSRAGGAADKSYVAEAMAGRNMRHVRSDRQHRSGRLAIASNGTQATAISRWSSVADRT